MGKLTFTVFIGKTFQIIEDVTYDPTLTRDYIPFLIGGYPDEVRKGLSYTKEETFYDASYEDKALNIS